MVGRERRDVKESTWGMRDGGERRDVTDSARGKSVGWEKRDVTDSARGKGSVGRDVLLQTEER